MKTAATGIELKQQRPLTVTASIWWGYVFCFMYILYGGVSIILSILDRQYGDLGKPILFLFLGLLLFSVVMAFQGRKGWGWYGMVAINGAVVLLSLFGLNQTENIVLMALCMLALVLLFLPTTKEHLFRHR